MKKQLVNDILLGGGYFVINKKILKKIGLEGSVLLSIFAESEYNLSNDEGWFQMTSETLENITGLSNHKQSKHIEKFIKLGILEQDNKGLPMKRHFRVNRENVKEIILS